MISVPVAVAALADAAVAAAKSLTSLLERTFLFWQANGISDSSLFKFPLDKTLSMIIIKLSRDNDKGRGLDTSQHSQKKTKRQRDIQEPGETRRLILQAAQTLFMTYGYRAVTTRQVADACGITQPALYRHFSDKQDLYVSVQVDVVTQSGNALERIAKRNAPMQERLRLTAIHLLNSARQDIHVMFHDMHYELSPEAQARIFRAFSTSVIAPISIIFEDGMQQGLLRPIDQGGVTTHTAVMLFLNLASQFLPSPQGEHLFGAHSTITERTQLMVDLFLYGLAKEKQDHQNS